MNDIEIVLLLNKGAVLLALASAEQPTERIMRDLDTPWPTTKRRERQSACFC